MKTKLKAEVSFNLPQVNFTNVDGDFAERMTDELVEVSLKSETNFPSGCVMLTVGYQKVVITDAVVSLMHTFIKSQSYINEKMGSIADLESAESESKSE